MHLTTADYVVVAFLLMIPVGIGFLFAWKDSRKACKEEYLLAGRKMKIFPVALSLFVTFLSAISVIGVPGDVYHYGAMIGGMYIANCLGCLMGYFTMIPLMHPLRITSVYEYLEMRYKSRAVRKFSTVVGMIQTFFYMVIAMLAPGLALQALAGIPFWISVAVVGGIGTFYTAIGGIKSVIWTDVFQALVLFIGILLLIVMGTLEIGGASKVWNVAEEGGRLSLASFSPDPRIRHTWWGMAIGGSFTWLSNVFSQSSVQRMSTMKSIRSAKQAYLWNIPCHLIFGVGVTAVGVVTYSYFFVMRCDPLEGGLISNVNQISLYFMLHVFQKFPGLAGLYMAAVFSGALSTLSSGINSLTANTVEDILKGCLSSASEGTIVVFAKFVVFVYGSTIVGFAYLAKSLQGPITQMTFSIIAVCGSVLVGIFLAGCTVPWANKYGVFAGGILSFAVNVWLTVGAHLYGRKDRLLLPPPSDQCNNLSHGFEISNSKGWPLVSDIASSYTNASSVSKDASNLQESSFFLYDLSYLWTGFIGTLICGVTILIVSKLTHRRNRDKTDARLIIPSLHKFWYSDLTPEEDQRGLESLQI